MLLGALDLDLNYESTLFIPLLVPPVGFGPASASATTFSKADIVLSDDLGNSLSPIANPSTIVKVPTLITLSLIEIGLVGIGYRKIRIISV